MSLGPSVRSTVRDVDHLHADACTAAEVGENVIGVLLGFVCGLPDAGESAETAVWECEPHD
jgi:hypothetical protein